MKEKYIVKEQYNKYTFSDEDKNILQKLDYFNNKSRIFITISYRFSYTPTVNTETKKLDNYCNQYEYSRDLFRYLIDKCIDKYNKKLIDYDQCVNSLYYIVQKDTEQTYNIKFIYSHDGTNIYKSFKVTYKK
jgi:hypothetical protein